MAKKVEDLARRVPGFKPGLAIVQVGGREDSNVYIKKKIEAAGRVGVQAQHVKLPRTATQNEVTENMCLIIKKGAHPPYTQKLILGVLYSVDMFYLFRY